MGSVVALVMLMVGCSVGGPVSEEPDPGASTATSSAPTADSTPAPTRDDPVARALAADDHPDACAITFDGADEQVLLVRDGDLFPELPIPSAETIFAGWYADPRAAADLDRLARIDRATRIECHDRRLTLTAGWASEERVAEEQTSVPILMYHQYTERAEGEDHWLRLNYTYTGDFADQMAYLRDEGFFYPSWRDLEAFIDGRMFLPQKSVIVTADDADATWLDLGVPIVVEHEVLATSFVITQFRSEGTPSEYVLQRSHTHDMHRAGANGDGMMVNEGHETIVADLERSADVVGAKEVLCYPFGHVNEIATEAVRDAGFDLAVTIEPGTVTPGADKLFLPRVRIDYGISMDDFVARLP